MAEYFSFVKLIEAGGVTLAILLICSIVSLIIIIERLLYFRTNQDDGASLLTETEELLRSGKPDELLARLLSNKSIAAYVMAECLQLHQVSKSESLFEEVKSRALAEKIPEMERYLNIEATLASVSPFIGLFGTVLGIIRSFQSMGVEQLQSTAMVELNAGIAAALIATAAGLFVAIPATIAYNYFRRRVKQLIISTEIAASRLKQLLYTLK